MKAGSASRTAQYMALFRALETTRSKNERLFTDPYARLFPDRKFKIFVWLSRWRPVRRYVEKIIHKKIPGAYSSGIARTRYIDDLLQQSIQQGVQQVIILGAGFDTRALRLDFLQSIPVIEIDHPNTSRQKQLKLKRHQAQLQHTRFIQADFNTENLEMLATKYHLDYTIPTAVVWEGVSNYLTAEAVEQTFAFVNRFRNQGVLIFTYIHQQALLEPRAFYGLVQIMKGLEKLEERWTFGIDPLQLKDYLGKFNLTLIEDAGADEYRNRYLPGRTEKGYDFYRVALATNRPANDSPYS